jgi:ribosome assembly protein YihI (activator of Der GTPase)
LKFDGDLTTRRTLVTYVRNDNFSSKKVEQAMTDLSTASNWTQEDIDLLLANHRMSLSWQVPVDCELDRIMEAVGSDEEDDDDLFADMNARSTATQDIAKHLTPTKKTKSTGV